MSIDCLLEYVMWISVLAVLGSATVSYWTMKKWRKRNAILWKVAEALTPYLSEVASEAATNDIFSGLQMEQMTIGRDEEAGCTLIAVTIDLPLSGIYQWHVNGRYHESAAIIFDLLPADEYTKEEIMKYGQTFGAFPLICRDCVTTSEASSLSSRSGGPTILIDNGAILAPKEHVMTLF